MLQIVICDFSNFDTIFAEIKTNKRLKHFFEKLEWAKGKIATMYGNIEVDWSKNGNAITYNITIPENTSAIFKAPNGYRLKKANKDTELESGIHSILLERASPSKSQ